MTSPTLPVSQTTEESVVDVGVQQPSSSSDPNATPPLISRARSGSTSVVSDTGRTRSGSVRSGRRVGQQGESSLSSPPNITSFNLTQMPPISTTHAGGIQPSASFFHPSRPIHSFAAPQRPLSELSDESHGRASVVTEDHNRQASLAVRDKVSRELLLPMGTGGGSASMRKPSILRSSSQQGRIGAMSSGAIGPGGRVRNSLEKMFRRTLSIDSSKPKHTLDRVPISSPRALEDGFAESKTNFSDFKHPPHSPDNPTSDTHVRPQHSAFNSRRSVDVSAVPVTEEKTGRPTRKWKLHPSRNIFFFRGQFLTGGDSFYPFIGSLTLVLGISGVWLGTTCVWWWHNESPAVAAVGAYMVLLTVANMFATAFKDPGILPRNLDPEPPYPPSNASDDGNRGPLPRDLKVRAGIVRVKYCQTCRTYRPPRSSHCRMCDNCVDGCDHHCQWVNNCVGRRNYTSFIVFLTSAVLSLCLIIATSALQLYWQTRREDMDFHSSLNHAIGSAVAFSLSIIVIWPVAGLLGYHMRLLFLNLTTVEQIRNTAHKSLVNGPPPPNPFALGNWRHNLAEMLCRPQGLSWLNASAVATEDKREPNPGFSEPELELEGGENNSQRSPTAS
ncbi:zf-DHHC-domain-containing protein [Rickenella mellea]|uniref:Palmitoyltransferase n=1 Tax=Rickenella mellea TaxID=50990 RepID=A0A4Y7QKR4_9AGAM|nr:zf-DHHC-domain-containing protein [Rickenella mellea]